MPAVDVQSDLINAKQKGEDALQKFVQERLTTDTTDFFAPIKQQKLKTFSDIKKIVTVSASKGKTIIVQEDRNLFCKIFTVNDQLRRKIDLKDMFQYSLGTYPYALATVHGCLVKTNKSKLMECMERGHDPIDLESIKDKESVWIYDAMAILQQLGNSSSAERTKRATCGEVRVKITGPTQRKTLQWKKFLSNGSNKTALVEFLYREWSKPEYAGKLKGIELVVTHGTKCHSIKSTDGINLTVNDVQELSSTHEEADTRLLLHAAHAAQTVPVVVIRSPDTDVAVLAVTFKKQISADVYFDTGVKNRRRLVNINQLSDQLGEKKSSALLGLHAFTGCDAVSAFTGKGKVKGYDLLLKDEQVEQLMCELGTSSLVSPELMTACEMFVCKLYGSQI
ncbi:hypothetical protein BSL78_19343 [Apostichopus japonicus]|uniref:Uncharacterized protein n=1 Tax=Stichopus japonicus TaxID=307972 RepID=A0A2G8K761_STIJA|nr:hypothetical protein BSL78_19343 [Apostichopus japonicus]